MSDVAYEAVLANRAALGQDTNAAYQQLLETALVWQPAPTERLRWPWA